MDQDTTTLGDYYNQVPYDSHPFPQSSPEHLEAIAFLFGLSAPPPERARVLELGCAAGGNLIPFAARHPQAHAVGIDLSPVQVRDGLRAVRAAGLSNVELHAVDLSQIEASLGRFDYIICHGVYSWVPAEVQDAILRVCQEHLAPEGVAYVSYNTYPGWKAREIVRDAMVLRGAPRGDPTEKLAYARGMLDFLEQSARPQSVLHKTLEDTMPTIRGASDAYLLHEFLEPCNAPCYFKQFTERAAARGLAYLAEAGHASMFVQNYGEAVREPLLRECGGSQVLMEQYLDFLVNRTFRQTLLVQGERAGQIRYRLAPERLLQFHYAGSFAPVDGAPLSADDSAQACTALRGASVTLRLPVHKAVAQVLDARFPATVAARALVDEVAARLGQAAAAVEGAVLGMLEELVIMDAVLFRRSPPAVAAEAGPQPLALPSVRRSPGLPLTAGPNALVCNQWHEPVGLSLLERCLLPLLDGEHSQAALGDHLVAEAKAQRLRFIKEGQPLTDDAVLRSFAQTQVSHALADLRRKALLT